MSVYLNIPIALPGDDNQKLKEKLVDGRIQPGNVVAYHEGYHGGTFLYLAGGTCLLTTHTVEEYENAVREYFAQVGKKLRGGMIKPIG